MSSAGASTAAWQAGAARASAGSPLDALFQQFGLMEGQTLLQEFLAALYAGVNPREIAQELADTIDQLSYGRAELIMRTESLGAWNDAALENYRANSDIIGSWMWVCMPGAGTCVSCLEEDGTIYSLDEELDDHPNGRCCKGPVTNDYGDILSQYGIDASGEDFGPGPWDDRQTGEEWLLAQDAEIQRQAFGSNAAFNAWKVGDAELKDFVAIRHDAQWGDSIYQQSLKGMGLDARDYAAGTAKAAEAEAAIAEPLAKGAEGEVTAAEEAFKAASAATESTQEVITAADERLSQDQLEKLIANREVFTDPNMGRTNFWTSEIDGEKYFIRPAEGPNTTGVAETSLADRVGLGEHYVNVQTGAVDGVWYEIQPLLEGHQFADLADTTLRNELATDKYLSKDERMKIDLFSSLISDGDRYAQNMWLTEDGKLLQIDYDAFSPTIYPPSGDLLRVNPSGEDITAWNRLNDAPKPSAEVREWMRSTLLSPENKQAILDAAQNLSMPSYLSEARAAEERAIAANFQQARLAAFEEYANLPGAPNLGKLREIMESDRIQAIAAGEDIAPAAELAGSAGEGAGRLTYTLPEIDQQAEQALIQQIQEALSGDGVTSHTDAIALGSQIRTYLDERIGPLSDWADEVTSYYNGARDLPGSTMAWIAGDTTDHGGLTMQETLEQYQAAVRQETVRLTQQVRGVGETELDIADGAPQTLEDALRQVQDVFPTEWLDASNEGGDLTLVRLGDQRGYYRSIQDGGGTIGLRYNAQTSPSELYTAAVHELGHRMEDAIPGVWEMERDFYDARTADEEITALSADLKVAGRTKKDDFANEYLGKLPVRNVRGEGLSDQYHYELLSSGLEWLLGMDWRGAWLLSKDEEYYRFILGILFGVNTGGEAA